MKNHYFVLSLFLMPNLGLCQMLDVTFGYFGNMNYHYYSEDSNFFTDSVIQSDGKIVAVGELNKNGDNTRFLTVRIQANGLVDNQFGGDTNSAAMFNYGIKSWGKTVALQNDGKIIVAGETVAADGNVDLLVLRYLANGTLDTSFGVSGMQFIPRLLEDTVNEVVVTAEGKIILAGKVADHSGDFALVQLNANGSLDTTFGTSGYAITHITDALDEIRDVKLLTNGKILASGYADAQAALVKYLPNGNVDGTFGNNGIHLTSLGSQDVYYSILPFEDEKFIVAGSFFDGNRNNSMVERYLSNGELDSTFAQNGRIVNDFGLPSAARSVILDLNGRIAVGYDVVAIPGIDYGVGIFQLDGSPYVNFGANGFFFYDLVENTYHLKNIHAKFNPGNGILVAGTDRYLALSCVLNEDNLTVEPMPDNNVFAFSPNPVNENTTVRFKLGAAQKLTFELVNLHGMVLSSTTEHFESGSNSKKLYTENWSEGIYLLKISNNSGPLQTVKVVVSR